MISGRCNKIDALYLLGDDRACGREGDAARLSSIVAEHDGRMEVLARLGAGAR